MNRRDIYPASASDYELTVTPSHPRPGAVIEVVAPSHRTRGNVWQLCSAHADGWRLDYYLLGPRWVDLEREEMGSFIDIGIRASEPATLTLPSSLSPGTYQLRTDGAEAGTAVIEVVI